MVHVNFGCGTVLLLVLGVGGFDWCRYRYMREGPVELPRCSVEGSELN